MHRHLWRHVRRKRQHVAAAISHEQGRVGADEAGGGRRKLPPGAREEHVLALA
jgi:hypothetical protein